MSPLFFVTQIEVLVANGAPKARILAVVADLRRNLELREIGFEPKTEDKPEENTASIPVALSPEMNVPLDPPTTDSA
jgi:hypothetical protein